MSDVQLPTTVTWMKRAECRDFCRRRRRKRIARCVGLCSTVLRMSPLSSALCDCTRNTDTSRVRRNLVPSLAATHSLSQPESAKQQNRSGSPLIDCRKAAHCVRTSPNRAPLLLFHLFSFFGKCRLTVHQLYFLFYDTHFSSSFSQRVFHCFSFFFLPFALHHTGLRLFAESAANPLFVFLSFTLLKYLTFHFDSLTRSHTCTRGRAAAAVGCEKLSG